MLVFILPSHAMARTGGRFWSNWRPEAGKSPRKRMQEMIRWLFFLVINLWCSFPFRACCPSSWQPSWVRSSERLWTFPLRSATSHRSWAPLVLRVKRTATCPMPSWWETNLNFTSLPSRVKCLLKVLSVDWTLLYRVVQIDSLVIIR